jgi:hypothetical protein
MSPSVTRARAHSRRHHVRVGRRRGPQFREGALDLGRIALRPGVLHPPLLLALQLRVDAEDRDLLVLRAHVVVHPDDDPLLGVHLTLEAEGGVGDLALREARSLSRS